MSDTDEAIMQHIFANKSQLLHHSFLPQKRKQADILSCNAATARRPVVQKEISFRRRS
jgi:hypothetical protein